MKIRAPGSRVVFAEWAKRLPDEVLWRIVAGHDELVDEASAVRAARVEMMARIQAGNLVSTPPPKPSRDAWRRQPKPVIARGRWTEGAAA